MTNQKPEGKPDPVKAKMFAEIAHSGQTYNEEVPYTFHLQCVVDVLGRYGETSPEMVCAAWLHDSIEDTNKSYNDIKSRFGMEVAELVYSVTSELGRNRKERNEKTYPKLKSFPQAMLLKLADRIANVEYGAASGGKNDMYSKEFPDFFENLYQYNSEKQMMMWNHLARLLGFEIKQDAATLLYKATAK